MMDVADRPESSFITRYKFNGQPYQVDSKCIVGATSEGGCCEKSLASGCSSVGELICDGTLTPPRCQLAQGQNCPSSEHCQGQQGCVNSICCNPGFINRNAKCHQCGMNFYADQSANKCQHCPPGTHSTPRSSICCHHGSIEQSGVCQQCEMNTYQSGNQCQRCLAGTHSRSGSSRCLPLDCANQPGLLSTDCHYFEASSNCTVRSHIGTCQHIPYSDYKPQTQCWLKQGPEGQSDTPRCLVKADIWDNGDNHRVQKL